MTSHQSSGEPPSPPEGVEEDIMRSRDHEHTGSIALEGNLLPCPFCGSPAELERDSDHHGEWFNLGCSRHWGRDMDDRCHAGRIWYTETELTEAEAVTAWNRRAPSSAAQVAGDSSRDELEALSRLKADVVGVLEPFAEAHANRPDINDAHPDYDRETIWESPSAMCLEYGHLKAAAALLTLLREGGMEAVVQTNVAPQCGVGPSDPTGQEGTSDAQ